MKLYDLDTVLTFGQYRGETVFEILKKDIAYITDYCLKQGEDFYITDEVFEVSIIYGYKGIIDGHIKDGHDAYEAINICKEISPVKELFIAKKKLYKDHMLKKYKKELEAQLAGNGNITVKYPILKKNSI